MASAPSKKKSWNRWGTAMVISAVAIIIAPMFGLFGTVVGMVGAFGELGETGGADPEEMAGHISTSLTTTAGGLVVSVIMLPCFIIFLILFLKQKKRDSETRGATES